jgi:D-alanyl-D-alanine carboxypeptidase
VFLGVVVTGCGPGRDWSSLSAITDSIQTEMGAPGAIIGVRLPDGSELIAVSGLADRERAVTLDRETPFFLGSISKTYTAALILRLAEAHRLSLDDPIDRYLPGFPRGGEIRIRHLLTHTSGLKDFYTYMYYRPDRAEMIRLVTQRWSEQELLQLAGRFGHWFDPGTDWGYSNAGYYLLGVIAERAGGATLPELFRRHIYRPLGLERTLLWMHDSTTRAPPTGYMGPVEGWKHSEMFGELGATSILDTSSVEWGAGGVIGTASEALRFMDALLSGGLVSPSSLEQMMTFRNTPPLGIFSKDAPPPSEMEGYGMGLATMRRGGFSIVGHGGLFSGHSAGLWHLPDCDVTFVLYLNRGLINQRLALDRLLPAIDRLDGTPTTCRSGPRPN